MSSAEYVSSKRNIDTGTRSGVLAPSFLGALEQIKKSVQCETSCRFLVQLKKLLLVQSPLRYIFNLSE